MLWAHGIVTLGCCSGHGKENPSVVISNTESMEKTQNLLESHDPRTWEVLQWQLVRYIRVKDPAP